MNILPLYLNISIFIGNPQRNNQSLLGALCTLCFRPRLSGIPHIAITPEKVENNIPKKEGVKGMLPTYCLPLWGERGLLS
jgi:hypothetical protein